MKTRLLLVRHGESEGNAARRLQGWLDTRLTERGREQARLLARRLEHYEGRITAIYTSPLSRAYDTAQVLAQRLELPLITDERLKEIHLGALTGLTWDEVVARFPEYAQAIAEQRRPPIPGGEDREAFADRVWEAITEIVGHHPDEDVLIVSHGGAINAYLIRLLGLDPRRRVPFLVGNASLSIVQMEDGRPHILSLNDRCHLDHHR